MVKLKIFIILILACSFLFLSGCVSKSEYNKLQAELQTTRNDLQASQADVDKLNTEINAIKVDLNTTKNILGKAQTDLEISEAKLKLQQDNLDTTNSNLKSVQDQLDIANKKIKLYQDTLGITVNSNIEPPYKKTTIPISPINLIYNQVAQNPTWRQLVDFIQADKTDSKTYLPGIFMCGGFAEEVHNNAEAAGIRAAMVAIDFTYGSVGHAINAFNTTDRGLVYIDCTGEGLQKLYTTNTVSKNNNLRWDKMAYPAKNKEYGVLTLDINDSADYSFYQKAKAAWDDYNQKVVAFNQKVLAFNNEIKGKVYYIGTSRWQNIKQKQADLKLQSQELDKLGAKLTPVWEPLGIVSTIEIYW